MDNFYDFNDEFDGSTGSFRQPSATMQQSSDTSVTAPLASAPSAVSSALVRQEKKKFAQQIKTLSFQCHLFLAANVCVNEFNIGCITVSRS